tara:strand:- start:835 stop:1020 length:186 start_codon:yes stop_codon:yes gene_type:complete
MKSLEDIENAFIKIAIVHAKKNLLSNEKTSASQETLQRKQEYEKFYEKIESELEQFIDIDK